MKQIQNAKVNVSDNRKLRFHIGASTREQEQPLRWVLTSLLFSVERVALWDFIRKFLVTTGAFAWQAIENNFSEESYSPKGKTRLTLFVLLINEVNDAFCIL